MLPRDVRRAWPRDGMAQASRIRGQLRSNHRIIALYEDWTSTMAGALELTKFGRTYSLPSLPFPATISSERHLYLRMYPGRVSWMVQGDRATECGRAEGHASHTF